MQQNRHNKQQTFCFDFMHFSNHDHYFLQTCILSQRSHYHSHHCTSANTIDVSYLCLNSFILNLLTSFHLISFYQQSHTFIHPVVFPLFCFIFVFLCVCKHTVITAKTTPAVPLLIPSRSHPTPSNPIQSNPTKPLITIMHLQQHPTQPNHTAKDSHELDTLRPSSIQTLIINQSIMRVPRNPMPTYTQQQQQSIRHQKRSRRWVIHSMLGKLLQPRSF